MLAKLVAAGIVFPEERGLERSFNFKHALVRDAAYESLLLMRRREWHGRVAQALEQRFGDIAAKEPELLAYHFGEAGLLSRLRLPHARRRPGREPLDLCGSDRAFLGGSQARRSHAAARRPAPATGVLAEAWFGVGRRPRPAKHRGRNGLYQSQRDRRTARRRPRILSGQMGPLDQRQSAAARRRWRATAPANWCRSRNSPAIASCCSRPIIASFQPRIFAAMSATCWKAASTPSRFTM